MSRSIARQAFWGFGITIIILCIVNLLSFRAVHLLAQSEDERAHSFRLMRALQKVESELKDADRAQRGYLLTSDPKVLAPYRLSLENQKQNFQTLRSLTSNDEELKQAIVELEKLVEHKQEDMRETIDMRGRVGFDAAVQIILSGKGNQIMDQIRQTLSDLIMKQNLRLQLRDEKVGQEVRSAKYAMFFGIPAALLVTIFAGFMISGSLRDREKAALALKAAHEGLEQKVIERTAELESANAQLQNEVAVRKKTEIALEKQQHFLRAVLDSLDEGIVACDENGQVVFVNDVTRQIFCLPDRELSTVPADWRKYYSTFEADGSTPIASHETPLHRALRGEVVRNLEMIIEPGNGDKKIVTSTGQRIIAEGDESLGAVVALRDITEMRRNEMARQAQQTAEAANRAKSEFLSRMSHELRTPLNAILGFAQLLQMDARSPEDQESISQILRGGRHLLSLINEVLDISRIEVGRLAVSPEPVLLSEAVDEVISLITPLAGKKNVKIESYIDSIGERYVKADRQRIKQVLMNLLSNAVKYNRVDGWIHIDCEMREDNRLRITVSDSGYGIPAEYIDRLFTPFDRLNAEGSEIEGTGLGLCLSKGFVELMGGKMGAESSEGQGSVFWFELAAMEKPWELKTHLTSEPTASIDTDTGYTAKVLYIEDNESNLRLIEQILAQRPGVTLIPAMAGHLGIELARTHQPDVIFLDLNLPDIHGRRVLQELKQLPETSAIPVIVISADATPGEINRIMAAGANNYLTKPINVLEFLKELDNIKTGTGRQS